jgi:metal-sulfur cluster biosynthetic enzyme
VNDDVSQLVRGVVADIVDPCSLSTGVPMNLLEMGMLKGAVVSDGVLTVQLIVTSPGCFYGPMFEQQVRERLIDQLGDRLRIEVTISVDEDWTESDIDPRARARLAAARAARHHHGVGRPITVPVRVAAHRP